jgi:hypothetical protein
MIGMAQFAGVSRSVIIAMTMAACWSRAPAPAAPITPAKPRLAEPTPVPRRDVPRAEAILDAMARTYANASTYTDHGEVATEQESYTRRMPFATVFSRVGGFRFEFETRQSREPLLRGGRRRMSHGHADSLRTNRDALRDRAGWRVLARAVTLDVSPTAAELAVDHAAPSWPSRVYLRAIHGSLAALVKSGFEQSRSVGDTRSRLSGALPRHPMRFPQSGL